MGGKHHSYRYIRNPNIQQLLLAMQGKESRSATNCPIIDMSNKEHNKDDDARRPSRSRTTPTAAAAAAGQGSASSSSAPSQPSHRRRGRQDLVGTHYRLATETHMDRYAQQHLAATYHIPGTRDTTTATASTTAGETTTETRTAAAETGQQ